jgi:hypothetical protein
MILSPLFFFLNASRIITLLLLLMYFFIISTRYLYLILICFCKLFLLISRCMPQDRIHWQFFLHVEGQKNLNLFPVPGCTFLHLFLGFIATNDAHVFEGSPANLNEAELSHRLLGAELRLGTALALGTVLGA